MKRMCLIACSILLAVEPGSGAILEASGVPAIAPPAAQSAADDNDGTDPTKPTSQIKASYDRQNSPDDFATSFYSLEYNRPLGNGSWVLRPKVQFGALSGPGLDSSLGIGDASIKLTKVIERTPKHGIVASFEVLAPTGSSQIGGGKWLVKPNLS